MQFSFISGIGQPTTAVAYELFIIASVVIGAIIVAAVALDRLRHAGRR